MWRGTQYVLIGERKIKLKILDFQCYMLFDLQTPIETDTFAIS